MLSKRQAHMHATSARTRQTSTPSSRSLTPDPGCNAQHPDDRNAAWLPKIIVLIGLFLTCAMVLMLPFDASMSQSCESDPECGVVGTIAQVWYVHPPAFQIQHFPLGSDRLAAAMLSGWGEQAGVYQTLDFNRFEWFSWDT